MSLPKRVKIVEVGPRDGLQNEPTTVPTDVKFDFILKLIESGLNYIEASSFVSAKKIPQLADHFELLQQLQSVHDVHFPVLVPNDKGMRNALETGVKEVSVFTAVSETFNQKNINCSIEESFQRIADVAKLANDNDVLMRGYISCVFGCPYEGKIATSKVAEVANRLYDLGCYEVSLGDTIGVATPANTINVITEVSKSVPVEAIAGHFHDTYGQAIANIYAALQLGVSCFDSSVSGLGGCPYAKGASGNVATEDVLYLMNGLGIETGIEMLPLIEAGAFINKFLKRETRSKVARAMKQR